MDEDGYSAHKHKRSRRKKLHGDWQEQHKDDMARQLERRFQDQSTPIAVEMTPLPSESVAYNEGVPRLTEKDYECIDYMKDEPVVSTHSAEIQQSFLMVRYAEDAEKFMLEQANTTLHTVNSDFREKVLKKSLEKRQRQVDVPYIKYPSHWKHSTAEEMEDDEKTSTLLIARIWSHQTEK